MSSELNSRNHADYSYSMKINKEELVGYHQNSFIEILYCGTPIYVPSTYSTTHLRTSSGLEKNP